MQEIVFCDYNKGYPDIELLLTKESEERWHQTLKDNMKLNLYKEFI